jgi:uroporphyrinogen decarboxylase
MKINMNQWVEDIIRRKEVTAMPVMTHPGIEMNGNTVHEAVSNGRIHAEAVERLTQTYPAVAACTIMDLTTEAEAFGAEIAFSDDAVPAVAGHMLTDVESINQLQIPSLHAGRIPQYLKANLLAARAMESQKPVFAGCIGTFSLAGRLYDMSGIMMLIYENPDAAHTLLAKCTQFIEKYCEALKLTGVNGVLMAEPAAGLLSNDDCKAFSSAYVKYIVNKVQDDHFIVVLHNCGNTGHCTEAMVETGAAAYHFGNKCRMEKVIKEVPKDALAMGNLDPVSIFKDGTPAQMREATLDLLEKMREYPNFVLSSGCDTPPHTPIENVNAFFEALNEWNKEK